MEQGGGDEREHVEPALGRRQRLGRIKALDRLGGEISLGQQRGGQRLTPLAKARWVSLAESFMAGQWAISHFAARARLAYAHAHEPGAGRGGEAPRNPIAELDADAAALRAPRALVFNSGLGGLSVLAELTLEARRRNRLRRRRRRPFHTAELGEAALIARVETVIALLIGETEPDIVVIACSTASTLALPLLRAAYPHLPFVGTVPAIKPAAAVSRSGLISVLATRGTVARDYTHDLVRDHAEGCEVTLVGSSALAVIAERSAGARHSPAGNFLAPGNSAAPDLSWSSAARDLHRQRRRRSVPRTHARNGRNGCRPQAAQVESLNAGVAASIVLYEAAKSQKSEVKMQK